MWQLEDGETWEEYAAKVESDEFEGDDNAVLALSMVARVRVFFSSIVEGVEANWWSTAKDVHGEEPRGQIGLVCVTFKDGRRYWQSLVQKEGNEMGPKLRPTAEV